MFDETSVAPTRSNVSAGTPGCSWIRKPLTTSPSRSACACSWERRARLDRAGAETRHGGHDLEHRARHVAALRRPGEERLVGVVADRREALVLGRGIGDRGGVVDRRRGERQDLPGPRVEHDDGALVLAEAPDRGALELDRTSRA